MNSILEFSEFFKKLKKLNYLILGSLIILIILALLSGQYSIPPIDRDEARFAQASSQMIQTGDYVNIKFQDEIRAKKPIGIYWLQAFSAKIFGQEDIGSYRIPSLLSSIITLVFVGLITRLIFPLYQTLIVTLLFASSIVFMGEAHLAKTDATLLCLICIQQYFYLFVFHSHLGCVSNVLHLLILQSDANVYNNISKEDKSNHPISLIKPPTAYQSHVLKWLPLSLSLPL